MRARRIGYLSALLVLMAAWMTAGSSQCSARNEMSYMLLEGSTFTDDCTICGRPPIIVPMRGTFQLLLREQNPLFTVYNVQNIEFDSSNGILSYAVAGEGTYEIGGEVAVVQRMQLKVRVNELPDIELTTGEGLLSRLWPIIEIDVAEEPIDPLRVYSMHLVAAPVREIWFSTRIGFTSDTLKQSVSPGDLISHAGRVVKSNSDLAGRLGIMPVVPDLGLDAVDIAPGGEVLFSIEDDVFSETLGDLHHGDLLSDRGRIVRTSQKLTSAFMPQPIVPDVGLDALQVKNDGEILFSIEEELFSEGLGVTLRPGDLLSDKGIIVRTNRELLAKFEPVDQKGDVGLDAIHLWPGGEIWFSTEVGFQSKRLGMIGNGDLLSDNGSIIFRNLELLRDLTPLEDLADFGLDAFFLVSEDSSTEPSVGEIEIRVQEGSGDVWIEWLSDGKVFQVERADEPGGPYAALGPIGPEATYFDKAAGLAKKKSFYRIRLW